MLQLPYGNTSISCSDVATVLKPSVSLHGQTLAEALQNPINSATASELVSQASSVCLIVPDSTRPASHKRILPALLPMLTGKQVVVVVACGAHTTPNESFLQELLALVPGCRLHIHDCDHSPMTSLGTTSLGTPVRVNDEMLKADLVLGMGSVAIHPFAGLSGGPKAFVPGCADRGTITANHSLLTQAAAAPGRLNDNPLYNDLVEAAHMIENIYIINEALSPDGIPLGYSFGSCREAHKQAAELAFKGAAVPFSLPFDLVIASAGGYPRDINLYQAIKALEMASLACREGGQVILLAQCPEGVGSALYEEWAIKDIREQERMVKTRFTVGAHKAYLASRALQTLSRCVLVSELPRNLVQQMGFTPADSLDEALKIVKIRDTERTAVIPFATATLPVLVH